MVRYPQRKYAARSTRVTGWQENENRNGSLRFPFEMTSSVIYGIAHRVDSQKFGEGRSSGGFSCLCSLAIEHSFFPLPMGAAIASCAAQTWLRWTAQVGTVFIDHLPQAPILPTISTSALLLPFEHKNRPPIN